MPFEITVISYFFGVCLTQSAQRNSIQAQTIPSFGYFREPLFLSSMYNRGIEWLAV